MLFVFGLVILSFVRWVDRIARLGRMGNTIKKVEVATEAALRVHARYPALGAVGTSIAGQGTPVFPDSVGYIQNVDIHKLQCLAERHDGSINLCALPGSFVTPGSPLAFVEVADTQDTDDLHQKVLNAFVIANQRTFELDPCFGLIVLSEIASRALSPAVNDCGTAIDIIGTQVRLFYGWSRTCREQQNQEVKYDRVSLMPVSVNQMFDDAFNAISRDGAAYVEVAICLQEALYSLTLLGDQAMRDAAIAHARLAYRYARESLPMAEELDVLKTVTERCFDGFNEDFLPTAQPGRGNEDEPVSNRAASDKPGRAFEQGGEARHTMDPGQTRVEKEAERFAGEIARQIDKLRTDHALSQLTLVAEPTMLGLLRKKLSAPAKELIRQTFSKDLAQLSDEEIQKTVQRAA